MLNMRCNGEADRQTDKARYSCKNRPHLRSTAMRPNNGQSYDFITAKLYGIIITVAIMMIII